MKSIIKYSPLYIIGLLVSIVIYPIMHEFGHLITALLANVRIVDINIFPLSYISCDMENATDLSVVAVGMGGMLMPFFISCVVKTNFFWLWYANIIIQFISLFSFVMSGVSALLFVFDIKVANDDVAQILNLLPNHQWIIIALLLLLTILIIVKIIRSKFAIRLLEYYL